MSTGSCNALLQENISRHALDLFESNIRSALIKAPFALYHFMRKRRGNVLFWPTVYTEPFFYPATDEDYCIRKCYRIYTMSFSYENVSIPFLYENDVV